jgi:hypothetical protein
MMNEAVSKRNFFLMLSVLGGQKLAADAGFSLPSEDVQRIELLDVFKKWMIMSGTGITEVIKECASWAVELNEISGDMSSEEFSDTVEALVSFSVALISYFLDSGTLKLGDSVDISEEMSEKFIREMFKSIIEDLDE